MNIKSPPIKKQAPTLTARLGPGPAAAFLHPIISHAIGVTVKINPMSAL